MGERQYLVNGNCGVSEVIFVFLKMFLETVILLYLIVTGAFRNLFLFCGSVAPPYSNTGVKYFIPVLRALNIKGVEKGVFLLLKIDDLKQAISE